MNEDGFNVPIIADGGTNIMATLPKRLHWCSDGYERRMVHFLYRLPAKIINGKKLYRGSTSFESKGERKHIEGITLELEGGFTYSDRLKDIQQALQSSISYAGGNDLSAFSSVKWERILPFH